MAYLKQLPYPLYSLWFFISGFSWMICLMGTCQLYLGVIVHILKLLYELNA
ncbi:hypothetical protein KSF78_0001819 [Schistosoma japonicum]|nr:hypothetical protein KSF78_0001819 [Schistosoma japonicum]KAH8854865.1 hypothetical protein KSF78_0001819 [Schistosoma japonicum]KAH8854866.1 hypothetical protein KSF78_0001819 [Schistosoma japonicum]KAH8854868.1 hypothetical protein KSF78_0001819 [Schistosoma japonicum]